MSTIKHILITVGVVAVSVAVINRVDFLKKIVYPA